MNNYEFCARWVLDQRAGAGNDIRVLDYGCGTGKIVKELRSHGIEAFGCDVFYEGGHSSTDSQAIITADVIKEKRIEYPDGVIREMKTSDIPFKDNFFDFVINNQVMEHVENLDVVLREISRVLKPGGIVLSLFPDKSVWREGHSGVIFLHWFPKGSRFAILYAAILRFFGFGFHKNIRGNFHFARVLCDWLDKWTYYRSSTEIRDTYSKYFSETKHIEDYWLRTRYESRFPFLAWIPARLQRLIVNKLGGLVFTARNKDISLDDPALSATVS